MRCISSDVIDLLIIHQVVLPTFILEKRSLLEMCADCMAHPDMFLKIPDLQDAESRFMAVLEWYLTSFHASRKVS